MLKRNLLSIVLISFLVFPNTTSFAQNPEPQEQKQAQEQAAPKEEEGTKTPPPQDPAKVVTPSETASTPSTGRKILKNFWSDEKAFFTSPFHINSDNAKWWGLFGGGTAALIATDRRLSDGLPNTASQIRFSKSVSQIGALTTTLPIAGGLYLYGRHANNAKARETGVLGAQALLDGAILVQILKLAAGRERPELVGGSGRFFKGHSGFPSGHAIETWSFASLISHEYAPSKIVPVVTYGLATVVSVSRFTGRKHYASDIVAGGAMGWFIGKYVWDHHQDPEIHKRYGTISRLMPEINPTVQPGSHTYGVNLAWR